MGWLRGLRRCSCTHAVLLPNFPLQCIASLLWACSLRSPTLCGFVQFLEVFLLVSSVARAVNFLSLDSCFLETSALTTLVVLVSAWTPIQLKPAWKVKLPKVLATESLFLWRIVYSMVQQMFVRFGRSLSADNWNTQSEDSKQASIKTLG